MRARRARHRVWGERGGPAPPAGFSGAADLRFLARAHVRYQGTDTALTVDLPMQGEPGEAAAAIRDRFERGYRRRFAFLMPHLSMVIESVSLACIAPGGGAP